MNDNKPIYLWKLLDDGSLKMIPIGEYTKESPRWDKDYIKYRDEKGMVQSFYVHDMEKIKRNRVFSYHCDKYYIWHLFSKTLFKKMMDTETKYNVARDLYINFKTKNKRPEAK